MDGRLDRDMEVKLGDKEESKTLFINVYLEVLNVFNTKNILSVYRATGNASDDGYLAAAEFQAGLQAQTNEQAFRDLYAIRVNNPGNYSQPPANSFRCDSWILSNRILQHRKII
jgi:hypothetical protein